MSGNRICGSSGKRSRGERSGRKSFSSIAWRGAWAALLFAAIGVALGVVADDILQVGEHVFEFRGVDYNTDGTSTWHYTVTSGRKPALSHWVIEWDPALLGPSNVVSCSEQYEVNTDPRTGVYGLKFDGGYRDNESREVWFTLDAWYGLASTQVGVKAGKDSTTEGPISGPGEKLAEENSPPAARDDAASVDENGSIVIDVLANDEDVDGSLNRTTVVVTREPGFGTADVDSGSGTVTYTPYPGTCGSDELQYTVEDNDGVVSEVAVVTIAVVCNEAPRAVGDSATTDEFTAVAVNVVANDSDADGMLDLSSVAIVRDPAFGALSVHPVTGVVSYTPAVGGCGDDEFEYTVADDDGALSNSATVIVTVLCTDPPLAIDDLYNVDEGGIVDVPAAGVLANDQETPGKPLSARLVSDVKHGDLDFHEDGSFAYTHDGSETTEDSFSYIANDSAKDSNVAVVSLVVAPTNDIPAAADDAARTREHEAVEIDVLANDSDPDLDVLSVDWAGPPQNGQVTNLGASVEYTPDGHFYGTDTFTYAASDGHGGTSIATVVVSIAPVNDDPLAEGDSATTSEDTAISIPVLGNDSDPDGDSLSVESVTQPENGSVVEAGASVLYTPNADFHGTDTFAYTVSDGAGGSARAVVNVVVASVNDAPLAHDGVVFTDEDVAIDIAVLATDSDPDGDPLAVDSVTQPAHGVVTARDDVVTYAPAKDFSGEDSFTYTISDRLGGTSTGTITVVVAAVDDAPVAQDDSASTDEGVATAIEVLANDSDPEGSALAIESVSSPSHGTAEIRGTSVIYSPAAGFSGTDGFSYVVADRDGGTAQAHVAVSVATVNHAPSAAGGHVNTDEDIAVAIAVLANDTDPDGDALTVQSVTQPSHGSVTNHGSAVTYTPADGFHGEDSFTYTISDGRGGLAIGTITVTVADVDDSPIARDDSASTSEDESVSILVLTNDSDPDGDALSIDSIEPPANGEAEVRGSAIVYNPAAGFSGVDTFHYTVGDGRGGSASAAVIVHVTSVNDAPRAEIDEASTLEDSPVTIAVLSNDSDPDGDALTILSSASPQHGSTIRAGANIVYTPAPGYFGEDTFSYTVADGNGGTDTAAVTVTVVSVNDAPVAQDDIAATAEEVAVRIAVLANDRDPDGDALAIQSVGRPSHGTAARDGDEVVYTPQDGYSGTDSFSYVISDGQGGSTTAEVSVTVTAVNHAPVAQDDSAAIRGESILTIEVLGNDSDPDGDFLLVQSLGTPAHGTLLNGRTTISYIPDPGFSGVDTFTYIVSDGNGGAATATVTVSVEAADQTPAAGDDSGVTNEDVPVAISVLDNDVDPDGDTLRLESISQPTAGTAARAGTAIEYTPAENWSGVDTFTYTVSDGRGGTATATVMVVVVEVNDPPVAQDDSTTTDMDVAVSIDVLENDRDPEGGALTVLSVSSGQNGTTFNEGSSVLYTPDPGFVGTDTFTYTVSDGDGATAAAAVTVGVAGVTGGGGASEDTALGGRVVISEVAWAGTAADAQDEWIELRNLGSEPVDLAGWTLQWRRSRPVAPEDYLWKTIKLSGVVPSAGSSSSAAEDASGILIRPDEANSAVWHVSYSPDRDARGYFLLERTREEAVSDVPSSMVYDGARSPTLALSDLGEVILLVNPGGDIVDTANASNAGRDAWAAGSTATFGTMERMDPFGADTAENWSTNAGVVTRGVDAQKRPLHGTPGARNAPRLETLFERAAASPMPLRAGSPLEVSFTLSRGDRRANGWPWIITTRPGLDLAAGAGGSLDASACSFSGRAKSGNDYALDIGTNGATPGVFAFWIVYGKGEALLVPVRVSP